MHQHRLLLYWLLLAGAVLIGSIIIWHMGFVRLLIDSDVSRLSSLIILLFVLASGHAVFTLVRFSRETEMLKQFALAETSDAIQIDGPPPFSDQELPVYLQQSIEGIALRYHAMGDSRLENTKLLDMLETKLKAPVRLGWLLADLLIKLGLLGTVIGFILMLGTISSTEDIDISNIQSLLADMGEGMRVALFTTLSGLVTGTLLGFQYFIVDREVETLMGEITQFIETRSWQDMANMQTPE